MTTAFRLMIVASCLIGMIPNFTFAETEALITTVNRSRTFDSSKLKLQEYFSETTEFRDTWHMRTERKVGVGAVVGGATGVTGLQLDINFEDENGALAGFGRGPGYRTFNMAWKHNFPGTTFTPYTVVGYAHWYNPNGGQDYRDSAVLEQVLNQSERADGKFNLNFVYGSGGIQINQLHGIFAGATVIAELVLMLEPGRQEIVPNGAVGAFYYF